MENIKYEITEKDIKNYLNNHSKDELIRFKEALFVKYMKQHDLFSIEKIEILLSKSSNSDDLLLTADCCNTFKNYYNFNDFLKNQVVDTSTYMHILIPVLGYYKSKLKDTMLTNGYIEQFLPKDLEDYDCGKLTDTIENYRIAGKIKNINQELVETVQDIKLSKTECNSEINSYIEIYGIEPVEKIKKLVKEGC